MLVVASSHSAGEFSATIDWFAMHCFKTKTLQQTPCAVLSRTLDAEAMRLDGFECSRCTTFIVATEHGSCAKAILHQIELCASCVHNRARVDTYSLQCRGWVRQAPQQFDHRGHVVAAPLNAPKSLQDHTSASHCLLQAVGQQFGAWQEPRIQRPPSPMGGGDRRIVAG
jgi:hypothetical protein